MPLCTKYYTQWLEEEFLPYLDQREKNVETREGFTKTQKKQMLLSSETHLGLRMTGMHVTVYYIYNILWGAICKNIQKILIFIKHH